MDFLVTDNWQALLGTILNTFLAYVGLVLLLRFFGKRSLAFQDECLRLYRNGGLRLFAGYGRAKQIGSFGGRTAFTLLLSLQALITWLSVRSKWIKNLVTNQPAMLVYQGQVFHDVLKKERIAEEELWLAARKSGLSSTSDIAVAILETTGEITIIRNIDAAHAQTLQDVKHPANTRVIREKEE